MPDLRTTASIALDHLDRSIIDELQQEGRRPYTRIAHHLGVSEAAVRKRVARLTRKGVLQIVGAVDFLALGYVRADVGIRVRGPSIQKVAEQLAQVREISYIELVLGSFDISATLNGTDNEHLLSVRDDIRGIPGVEEVEAWTVLKVVKDIYHLAPARDI
jgi:Lrp/AsnC family transcriptional regulator for asnA, asnC and gidA